MNKLDYLAQKEEELRQLNEQLEQRNRNFMQQPSSSHSKKRAPTTTDLDDSLEHDTNPNPFTKDADFDASSSKHSTSHQLLEEAKRVRDSY